MVQVSLLYLLCFSICPARCSTPSSATQTFRPPGALLGPAPTHLQLAESSSKEPGQYATYPDSISASFVKHGRLCAGCRGTASEGRVVMSTKNLGSKKRLRILLNKGVADWIQQMSSRALRSTETSNADLNNFQVLFMISNTSSHQVPHSPARGNSHHLQEADMPQSRKTCPPTPTKAEARPKGH
jgi:hypothetical protein